VRIARFSVDGGALSYGVVEGDPGEERVEALHAHPLVEPARRTGEVVPLRDVTLGAPVVPSKVIGIGKNYADHVAEMQTQTGADRPSAPLLFLKPSTAVTGPGAPILLPDDSERVDYEGELCAVIGKITRRVTPDDALEHVFGWTCGNDVSARDQQKSDGQWTRAKGHDSFCPLGPWIETDLDPFSTRVTTTLDRAVVQDAPTSLLLFDVPTIISYVSHAMTLLPGDVIMTGTPAGVGPMRDGQVVTVAIAGVGELTNPVVSVGTNR
jgi:2-keto-4-pentenoate hydratase/2-oxohepta-3-ene-1,7-dioic acid hydratase in catechol pathway